MFPVIPRHDQKPRFFRQPCGIPFFRVYSVVPPLEINRSFQVNL